MLLISVLILFMLWKYRFGNDVFGFLASLFCILLVMFCTKIEMTKLLIHFNV